MADKHNYLVVITFDALHDGLRENFSASSDISGHLLLTLDMFGHKINPNPYPFNFWLLPPRVICQSKRNQEIHFFLSLFPPFWLVDFKLTTTQPACQSRNYPEGCMKNKSTDRAPRVARTRSWYSYCRRRRQVYYWKALLFLTHLGRRGRTH